MKKKVLLLCLLTGLMLGGCGTKNSQETSSATEDDSHIIYVETSAAPSHQNILVEKPKNQTVSAPAESISFEQACALLDSCGKKDFYLPEGLKSYQKYYFGTVDYRGGTYYSIYPYLDVEGKRLYAGTNCLVSVDGTYVLAQNWMGGYERVEQKTAGTDKPVQEMYPEAKVSPNEALAVLAKKEKALGLEYSIEQYVFETDEKLVEAGGALCYCFTPKLEYTDHMDWLKVYYVTADGSETVLSSVTGSPTEFVELK